MIRFLPDTLRDAIWRPIAMAAPDAGVYIEIMAPDLRFVILLILSVISLFFAWRGKGPSRATWVLAAFAWAAFVPWLLTTGNGRYFIPVLLLVGPLCIAMIHQLPLTAWFRWTAICTAVALQAFVLVENNPFGWWAFTKWGDTYYPIELTERERTQPATYITASSISYSLIALQFDQRSRWMNVASLHGDIANNADDQRAQAFLAKAAELGQPIRVVVPSLPAHMTDDLQPDDEIRAEINRLLGTERLALAQTRCTLLKSRGLATMVFKDVDRTDPARVAKLGFWICDATYPVAIAAVARAVPPPDVTRAFQKVEQACPRLFPPGEAASNKIDDGYSRVYPSSDSKLYVLNSGDVLFKYWRGLNPARVGSVQDVLADSFRMDCNAVPGRSGLPWERKL